MNQSQIFISYSRRDGQFACKLYDDLLSNGYSVWMDRRLEATNEWEPQVIEKLRQSKTLIALISSTSVRSDWVKHEGAVAFGLNILIIPVLIEPFGTYSASDLPIWAAKIQPLHLFEGTKDYDDQFQKLKQLLGQPLPIRQYLKEMLIHYKHSGMLLDEAALSLVERHYDELYLTKEEKVLADQLIQESMRKLGNYRARYDKLEKDYENAKITIATLRNKVIPDNNIQLLKKGLKVFLCHASSDKTNVRKLYKDLSNLDYVDPWLDEEKLLPGEDWRREIPKAIRTSDVVIVCLSRSSITKSGYVQTEIKFALDIADEQPEGTIFLIPLKFEECEVPERLSRWQWVNYFDESGYKRLCAALIKRAEAQ